MNFRLAKTHRYWWPVTVRIPDPETAGQFTEQQLKVQFEPLPRSEEVAHNEDAAKLKTLRGVTDFEIRHFKRIVKGWDGVVDGNGEMVPFSEDMLEQALQFRWFRDAVSRAFTASMAGDEARLGN